AAPSVDRPHPAPPSNELSGARRPGPVKSFPCVLPPGGRHSLVPKRSPAHVNNRATHPKGDEQLDHSDASQFSSSVVPPRHDSLTGWVDTALRRGQDRRRFGRGGGPGKKKGGPRQGCVSGCGAESTRVGANAGFDRRANP